MCKGCGGGRAPYTPTVVVHVPVVGEVPLELLFGLELDAGVYGSVTGTRYTVSPNMFVDRRDVPSLLKSGKVTNVPPTTNTNELPTIPTNNSG